jgi:hypothetical protein
MHEISISSVEKETVLVATRTICRYAMQSSYTNTKWGSGDRHERDHRNATTRAARKSVALPAAAASISNKPEALGSNFTYKFEHGG